MNSILLASAGLLLIAALAGASYRWLADRGLGLSRSGAQRLIEAGRVRVNGEPAVKRLIVGAGNWIEIRLWEPQASKGAHITYRYQSHLSVLD